MPRLIMVIDCHPDYVDPARTDPEELASYFIDPLADDPVPTLISAHWSDPDTPEPSDEQT